MMKTRKNKTLITRSTIIIGMFLLHAFAAAGSAGEIVGWGQDGFYGLVSNIPAGSDFKAVAVGGSHNVALKTDGSLVSWGSDYSGQVSGTPVGNDFIAVTACNSYSVALRSDGSLIAWGQDSTGQVSDTPTGKGFIDVSAGPYHCVALRSDGSIVIWGADRYGLFNIPSGNDFVAVESGYYHCVALRSDGSLVTWGADGMGQVSDTPSGNDFVAVAAGDYHCVALKSDGSLVAWGLDANGQVSNTPAGNGFVAVAAGFLHSIALKSDGSLVTWGYDTYGVLSDTPAGNDFTAVAAGKELCVAIRDTVSPPPTTYTLTTSVSPTSSSGSVAKNPNQSSYIANESVQLTATAYSGYTFSHWSGDASGTSNPIYITMNSNKTVTANFTAITKPTVSITATDASAGEPANDGSFRVSRTGDTSSNLLVYYSTSGSTASAGIDYTALPGYVDIPSGQSSAYIYIDVIDDSTVEGSETVRLTISSNSAYNIGSPSYATVTITDNDDPPPSDETIVTITAPDASAGEPANDGYFTVTRTGDITSNLLVYFTTSGSTASSGYDYEAISSYVFIVAGQSSASIPVVVMDDSATEDPETVQLTIWPIATYTVGSPSSATVTIADDDSQVPEETVVSIIATDASAAEPANDGYFRVSRIGNTSSSLRVYYSTSGSTATAGTDYAALPGYVDIPYGQFSADISVAVIDDSIVESSETVRLTISSNAAYTIGSPSYATVTITDDDEEPPVESVVTITAPDASASEPANDGYFRISRSGDISSSLRVYYSTTGSTASAGYDYEALSGYVDIPYGQSSANISVAVIDDYTVESSETVRLTISSNAAYDIGSPSNATVTITDDDDIPVEKPIVTIIALDASAGEPADNGSFRVSRTGVTSESLRVYYSTSGSTALSGYDYAALPGYVYIQSGQSSALISVVVIDDNDAEVSETLRLTISSNAAYTIGSPSNATVTITDDDDAYVYLPEGMMADTLDFFYVSVDDGYLEGVGKGKGKKELTSLKNMLETAFELIQGGYYEEACVPLSDAYARCDGLPVPPDYVSGEATADLAGMIQEVITALGCT